MIEHFGLEFGGFKCVSSIVRAVFNHHILNPTWYEQYKLFEKYNHMFLNTIVVMASTSQHHGHTQIENYRVLNPLLLSKDKADYSYPA